MKIYQEEEVSDDVFTGDGIHACSPVMAFMHQGLGTFLQACRPSLGGMMNYPVSN